MQTSAEEVPYITAEGKIRPLSRYFKPLRGLFLLKAEERLIKRLDSLESRPLLLPITSNSAWEEALKTSERLLNQSGSIPLRWRYVALKYRIEKGAKGSIDKHDQEWLYALATRWKKEHPLFWVHSLNPREMSFLDEALHYPEFIVLLHDPRFKETFFNWILRDRIPPKVFIEYPRLAEIINEYALNGRIGVVGGDKLKIQKLKRGPYFEKMVTLPFEGRDQNILDFSKIILFRGGLSLTIGEIFNQFKDKAKRFVDVEFFAQGITNWNAQHMGYLVPSKQKYEEINLEQREWWRQLPPIEILSLEEAKKRFGEKVNGYNWWISANAARQYLNLNFEKCHAYMEIAIPYKDGSYNIYDFGKFARYFPYGVVEDMIFFTVTTPATIAYPDENIYHTARQQVGYAFELNHFQGLQLMDEIRKDIQDAREGNLIFQVESENCAQWIQTHFEDLLGKQAIPNLFRVKLLKSDAVGIPGFFFNLIRKLPEGLQPTAMQALHYPFGAWKGQFIKNRQGEKIFKSLNKSHFWKDIIVYLPALLHKQFERGFVKPNREHDELD